MAAQRAGCQFAVELGGDRVPAWQRLKYPPLENQLECCFFLVFLGVGGLTTPKEIALTALTDLSSCFANKNKNLENRLTNETCGLVTSS